METMIYAFGLGLSFIAGLALGGWLLGRWAAQSAEKYRSEAVNQRDIILKHHDRVEARLTESATAHQEIAAAIKVFVARSAA